MEAKCNACGKPLETWNEPHNNDDCLDYLAARWPPVAALRARIVELERERDEAKANYLANATLTEKKLSAQLDRWQAENVKLRGALEQECRWCRERNEDSGTATHCGGCPLYEVLESVPLSGKTPQLRELLELYQAVRLLHAGALDLPGGQRVRAALAVLEGAGG